MKVLFKKSILATTAAVVVGLLSSGSLRAQEAREKLVDLKDPVIQVQMTPDFALKAGTRDKRWKQKEWLEIEVPFTAVPPRNAKADLKAYDSLTFTYYLLISPTDKSKQRILTADVTHVNVPINESIASVVYLSPSAILSLTGSPRIAPNVISMWGVEVKYNGTLVGFASSTKNEWWKANNAPATVPGMLLTKNQTPFAPLWGDYHAEVQSR